MSDKDKKGQVPKKTAKDYGLTFETNEDGDEVVSFDDSVDGVKLILLGLSRKQIQDLEEAKARSTIKTQDQLIELAQEYLQ